MVTTIRVSRMTREMLRSLRGQLGSTFDEVLRSLLSAHLNIPESLAGAYPQLKKRRKSGRSADETGEEPEQ